MSEQLSTTADAPPQRARKGWNIVIWAGGAVLLTMTFYVVANALSRKLFQAPFPFSVEITQFWFMPVLVCLGFIVAQVRDQHVAADLLTRWFPRAGRKWLAVGTNVLCIIVTLALAWFTFGEGVRSWEMGLVAGSTPLPIWPFVFALPIAFTITAVVLALQTRRIVRDGLPSDEALGLPSEVRTSAEGPSSDDHFEAKTDDEEHGHDRAAD